MATLKINEVRSVKFVGGVQTFEILITCTSRGDLPDTGLFVQQIINTRDPLVDVFQRIAAVADVEAYEADRDDAIAGNSVYWRSSSLKLTYNDIATADQAVRILSDRINTLTNDWKTYQDSFETPTEGSDYTFPTSDPTYITEIKDAYAASVETFNAAVLAQSMAQDDYDQATANLTGANASLVEWQTEYARFVNSTGEGINSYMGFADLAFSELLSEAGGIVDAIDTLDNDFDAILSSNQSTIFFKRVTLDSDDFVALTARDIGRPVTCTIGGGAGTLHYAKNSAQQVWISNVSGAFTATGILQINRGSGAEDVGTVIDSNGELQDPLTQSKDVLILARLAFQTILNNAQTKTTTLADGVSFCTSAASAVSGTVSTKTADRDSDQLALNDAKQVQIEAAAATTQAYNNVIAAYNTVKEVCPDWSPDPPLPATP
jgi:hypothetical protein